MLELLKKAMNKTYTENGAVTYESTGSECLDLFSTIGALRQQKDAEILDRFVRAYSENPDTAMKILFYARDIRGGLGERRVFRIIFEWLAENEPGSVRKNMEYVSEYGRFDDLLVLLDTACEEEAMSYLKKQQMSRRSRPCRSCVVRTMATRKPRMAPRITAHSATSIVTPRPSTR